MKGLFLRILMFVSLLVQVNVVCAQEFYVEVAYNQASTVVHDGTIYMLPGEVLDISIELQGLEAINLVNNAKMYIGSDVINLTTRVQDNNVEFENVRYIPTVYNRDLSLQIEFEYYILIQSEDGGAYYERRSLTYDHNTKLHLKDTPQIESVTSLNSRYYYAGTSIPLGIYTAGGNADGWEFGWPIGDTPSSEYTFVTNTDGAQMADGYYDNSFDVVVTNYAPDGETVWFTETRSFELYAYPAPVAEMLNREFTIQESETVVLSPAIEGGNSSTWSYKWYKGSALVAETRELEITGVNLSQNPISQDYRLVVTNSLTGTNEDYEVEFPINVTVNGITFAWKEELPTSVVEGDPINAEIVRTGGAAYEWQYSWLNDGAEIPGNNMCSFIAPAGTIAGRSVSLAFMAERIKNSDVPLEIAFNDWTSSNKANNSSSSETYTFNAAQGDVLTFDWSVSSESGYDKLTITLDGAQIVEASGENSNTFTQTFTSAGAHTLVVKYTKDSSQSSGSDQGRIYNMKLRTTVPQEATYADWTSSNKADSSTSSETYTIFAGEDFTLSFDWSVSSESGYDWLTITLDGAQIVEASGEKSNTFTQTFTSAGAHTLVVKYTKDGSQSHGSDQGGIYNMKLTDNEYYALTKTHEYVIYSQPTGEKTSSDDIALLHGQEYTFAISTQGGLPSGWTYEWFLDGVKIDGATTNAYTVKAQNNSNNAKNLVYKVFARNVTNNITRDFEFEFNVEIWPAASETHSDLMHDIYYGDNVTLAVDVTGGYRYGWRYEWILNNNVVSTDDTYNYYAASQYTNSKTQKIYLNVYNEHEKSPISTMFSKRLEFIVTSWSHGSVEMVSGVEHHRSGDPISVSANVSGGYPNWTYEWYYDGELLHTSSEPSYTFTAENNYSDSYVEDLITVVATNTIPKSGDSKSSQAYAYFTIWPVVEFPDEVNVGTVEYNGTYYIREGNDLPFSVDLATGGYNAYYDSYWTYQWAADGTIVKSSSYDGKNSYTAEKISGQNSNTKAVMDRTYRLAIVNSGPYGETWYSKTYDIPVKVYSKPAIPSSLVVKGNGNSNTLVCTSTLDDAVLESREYSFVFGYTDIYGEDHFMEPTTKRWYQFDSRISVKNPNYTFWVIARWDYSNDIYVTSGRRYLNGGTDNLFDASCFNNIKVTTRGDVGEGTTDIEQVMCDDVKFDGTTLVANAASLVDGAVEIFSIDGKCLDVIDLGRKQYFNEKIDMSEYESGIYIINVKIGETLVNKKVLVP